MRIRGSVMGPTGKWEKLENPARVAELSPADTLTRAGISDGDAVCDIGAGSGLFATAAAGLTHAAVYAVDTDADILARLAEKARAEGLSNLHTLPGVRLLVSIGGKQRRSHPACHLAARD